MTILTVFLVLNPAAVAAIWLGYRLNGERDEPIGAALISAAIGSAVMAVAAFTSEPILGALDISDATFRIAAGAVVVFGAFQAFLGFGLRHELDSRNWLVAATLVWLLSPPAVFAVAAVTVNDGLATGLLIGVAGVIVAVALGAGWALRMGAQYALLVGLLRRILAAGAAVGGVDLIRQGVLSI